MNYKKQNLNILNFTTNQSQPIHLIGIGGMGMGGLAEILFKKGFYITGSDIKKNKVTKRLKKNGIKIYSYHHPKNVINACSLIISTAISSNNIEIITAKKIGIPIFKRSEILAELTKCYYSIAVSGTHGKTTTTSIINDIYQMAGLNPTFINGGITKKDALQALLGKSHYLIIEADESDASFLLLKPYVIVITNIEYEHMETYLGDIEILKKSYITFLNNLPYDGKAILCIDDPIIKSIIPRIKKKIITYGFSKSANIQIITYKQIINKSFFKLSINRGEKIKFSLNIPGKHNILNATAAITTAITEKISYRTIIDSINLFQGIERRFDILGNFYINKQTDKNESIILIDDYGHHPTELEATIKTARIGWPKKRIIMLFQPHRYSRTKDLYLSFVNVLQKVDILLMLNIYSAGEKPILGINSENLCKEIQRKGKINPIFVKNNKEIFQRLRKIIKKNDLIIIQGAGNIENIAKYLKKTKLKSIIQNRGKILYD
ncbi:MAG: UDP-N-acetylmuramate--L-alanine ligase [Arsenophonus sp.]|nr:MAG: UDP-N-acetylmuramate--L-alanine ligase [Arsenophonus sp.]